MNTSIDEVTTRLSTSKDYSWLDTYIKDSKTFLDSVSLTRIQQNEKRQRHKHEFDELKSLLLTTRSFPTVSSPKLQQPSPPVPPLPSPLPHVPDFSAILAPSERSSPPLPDVSTVEVQTDFEPEILPQVQLQIPAEILVENKEIVEQQSKIEQEVQVQDSPLLSSSSLTDLPSPASLPMTSFSTELPLLSPQSVPSSPPLHVSTPPKVETVSDFVNKSYLIPVDTCFNLSLFSLTGLSFLQTLFPSLIASPVSLTVSAVIKSNLTVENDVIASISEPMTSSNLIGLNPYVRLSKNVDVNLLKNVQVVDYLKSSVLVVIVSVYQSRSTFITSLVGSINLSHIFEPGGIAENLKLSIIDNLDFNDVMSSTFDLSRLDDIRAQSISSNPSILIEAYFSGTSRPVFKPLSPSFSCLSRPYLLENKNKDESNVSFDGSLEEDSLHEKEISKVEILDERVEILDEKKEDQIQSIVDDDSDSQIESNQDSIDEQKSSDVDSYSINVDHLSSFEQEPIISAPLVPSSVDSDDLLELLRDVPDYLEKKSRDYRHNHDSRELYSSIERHVQTEILDEVSSMDSDQEDESNTSSSSELSDDVAFDDVISDDVISDDVISRQQSKFPVPRYPVALTSNQKLKSNFDDFDCFSSVSDLSLDDPELAKLYQKVKKLGNSNLLKRIGVSVSDLLS
ncbi:hypothetical protein RCL1_006078 [Eukaryota sp. TZLM3-RCL]